MKDDKCTGNAQAEISVIIAAKNESTNLTQLFKSLYKLEYPENNFEVILVDDNSTDNTIELAKQLADGRKNYRIYRSESFNNIKNKRAALTTGINNSKFENILITDADCKVSPNWLKCFSDKFNDFDFLIGIAPLIKENSLASRTAAFENLKSHILLYVFTKTGFPYSAAARNFGFKKAAFNKLGGFRQTTESLSGDDDLLIREAVKNRLKIGLVTAPDSFIYSGTKKSFSELFGQRARHTSSSHHYLFSRKLLLGIWHLINLTVLFSFLLSPYNSIFVLPIFVKLIVDYLVTNNFQNKFGYKFSTVEIVLLLIIYEVLIPVHFINSFNAGNRWS